MTPEDDSTSCSSSAVISQADDDNALVPEFGHPHDIVICGDPICTRRHCMRALSVIVYVYVGVCV